MSPATKRKPGAARPGGGRIGFFASDRGLSVLALVLAVLIWAVVWRKISDVREVRDVIVQPIVSSPDLFQAFVRDRASITLEGPTGELDAALEKLGHPPTIRMRVEDVAPGQVVDIDRVLSDPAKFEFPFNRRLVKSIEAVSYKVFRRERKDLQVVVPAPPKLLVGIPDGFDAEVVLEPDTISLTGPSKAFNEVHIAPDPVDVSAAFPEISGPSPGPTIVPAERAVDLHFSQWLTDEAYNVYRRGIVIPPVKAHVKFVATKTVAITNRYKLVVYDADSFDFAFQNPPPELKTSTSEYTGRFRGRAEALRELEANKDQWTFILTIPQKELKRMAEDATEASVPAQMWIAYERPRAYVELLAPSQRLIVTVTRKE